MLPYTWTDEHYDPRDYMRQRPLISEYTNELLVHPYFKPYGRYIEIIPAARASPQQLIEVDDSSVDDNSREILQHLALAPSG